MPVGTSEPKEMDQHILSWLIKNYRTRHRVCSMSLNTRIHSISSLLHLGRSGQSSVSLLNAVSRCTCTTGCTIPPTQFGSTHRATIAAARATAKAAPPPLLTPMAPLHNLVSHRQMSPVPNFSGICSTACVEATRSYKKVNQPHCCMPRSTTVHPEIELSSKLGKLFFPPCSEIYNNGSRNGLPRWLLR